MKTGFLPIGKIVGAHGVKGLVKVHSYGSSSAFTPNGTVLLKFPDGRELVCKVRNATTHKRIVRLSLENVDDRNSAEALVGAEFLIEKSELPETEEGAYYWADLIGLSVFKEDGDCLGRIDSILETGSNDVYVVKNDKGGETLIPALESVVLDIDPERKKMIVDLPEGL